MTKATVVVLNWNGGDDTLACLRTLRSSGDDLRVILVDNGSTDGSAERQDLAELSDILIQTGANLGYAGGNNAGIRQALQEGAQVVAVLNNDTLVEPGALGHLSALVTDNPMLVLAPEITYATEPHSHWFRGGLLDRGWPRHAQGSEIEDLPTAHGLRECQVLTGCCIVASAEAWRRIGLFDERLFLLFEDSDWSMRATRAGAALAVDQYAAISHKVSASSKEGTKASALLSFYWGRNLLIFAWRHQRRWLPRLLWRYFVRPAGRYPLDPGLRAELTFRWLGALAAITPMRGIAPSFVQRYASAVSSDFVDFPETS